MLIPHTPQFKFQMCLLEDLVPQDHLLRLVDQYIDFTFIKKLTYHLYCHDNGRPAIDPVVLFKMLFVGYIYGIRSERRLVEEFQVNLAYRGLLVTTLTILFLTTPPSVKTDVVVSAKMLNWNKRFSIRLLSRPLSTG